MFLLTEKGSHKPAPKIMAEMVGFEPTERITVQTISSRSRYDHFDTSPFNEQIYYNIFVSKNQGVS